MTVKIDLPSEIEQAYRAEAQAIGVSFDEIVREVLITQRPKTVFEQGLGLFGSPEDAALIDEVVSIAYKKDGGQLNRVLKMAEAFLTPTFSPPHSA